MRVLLVSFTIDRNYSHIGSWPTVIVRIMVPASPLWLLHQNDDVFAIVTSQHNRVTRFDNVSYTWGGIETAPYLCDILWGGGG
jgi:hypothetical protein